jgi:ribonuclease-3
MSADWDAAENRLGFRFENRDLLIRALTHSSHRGETGAQRHPERDNEQLEFLGDAVLGMVVSEHVVRSCPELDEGRLSSAKHQLVNRSHLADVSRDLGIGQMLVMGRGEETSGGRSKISLLANALEALLGAMYLDAGLEPVRAFILQHVVAGADIRLMATVSQPNIKTTVETLARARNLPKPEYSTEAENADFPQQFVSKLRVGKDLLTVGRGKSKKAAEMEAAREMLARISV